MSKLTRFIFRAASMWLVLTLLVYTFGYSRTIQAVRMYWFLLSLLVVTMMAATSLAAFFKAGAKSKTALAMLLVFIMALVSFKCGFGDWGARLHFYLHKNRYETVVSRIAAAPTQEEKERACGRDCWWNPDEPMQVTFGYAAAFHSSGTIVYDPTGSAAQPAPGDSFRATFTYSSAARLTGDWYYCRSTLAMGGTR